jgi:hypothetical protein
MPISRGTLLCFFPIAALIQGVAVCAGFAWWFYQRTEAYLAGPPGPDLYAHTWGFQLIVGALFFLGVAAALGILTLCEAFLVVALARQRRARV